MLKLIRLAAALAVGLLWLPHVAMAGTAGDDPAREVLLKWNRLVLELVRHTPTYSPPVASRAFAYLGVAGYEATASGRSDMASLAGQLHGLGDAPVRENGAAYDEAIILHTALADSAHHFFGNTGPTGQRAIKAMTEKLGASLDAASDPETAKRSADYGHAIAAQIAAWAETDGGARIENLGFPLTYTPADGPSHWRPTSKIALQQAPLLPFWGKVRPFAMPDGAACDLPPPPDYSEDPASPFYAEAKEVYDTTKALTDEQKAIARFWSDDPMLSPTPPGHWLSITLQLIDGQALDMAHSTDLLMRIGVVTADAFIGCWQTKYHYDLLRPVTYIARVIDKDWQPMLITPPFPEYPSGHSTQSGAAAEVLTAAFGDAFAFDDATHAADGIKPRHFASFRAAADEAALSRLYGGIHFRAAIERGLEQGRCIAKYTLALKTVN